MGAALLFRFPPIPSCLHVVSLSIPRSSRSVAASFDFVSISFSVLRVSRPRQPDRQKRRREAGRFNHAQSLGEMPRVFRGRTDREKSAISGRL